MYAINTEAIAIEVFAEELKTTYLPPSRRVLLKGLDEFVVRLSQQKVSTLADLIRLLKNRAAYPQLTADGAVSEAYLDMLRREANSYVTKPVSLNQCSFLEADEIAALKGIGVKNTKGFFEQYRTPDGRAALTEAIGVARTDEISIYADLMRVTGIGAAFAPFLVKIGVRGVGDLLSIPPEQLIRRYQESPPQDVPLGPELRQEDLEYCYKYAKFLTDDSV